MLPEKIFPLNEAAVGQPLRLVSITGGRKITHRLVEMGLTPGVPLRLLQNSGGPLLIAVRQSRIAVGRGMAAKMNVALS